MHADYAPKPQMCYRDSRATLHLHGGLSPWISDGTPHQWTTPADETRSIRRASASGTCPTCGTTPTALTRLRGPPAATRCNDPGDGALTFYYTNQQSARLMFYHDHAYGITRLNVLAGEAAGYVITRRNREVARSPRA